VTATPTPKQPISDRARTVLWVSVAITLALYLVPDGYWLIYPMMLFSTVVHELGHGVAGMLIGGDFHELRMRPAGGGHAVISGKGDGVGRAFVSAGGLCGPAVAAGVFLLVGRNQRLAKWCLGAFTLFLALSVVLWVRGAFGIAFTSGVVVVCGIIVLKAEAEDAQVALVFLATQLALTVFSRGDYLFTDVARGSGRPSDVQNMATALGGPYWFWGLVCGAFSVLVLVVAGWLYLRRPRYDRGGAKVARPDAGGARRGGRASGKR
jgi:hypothetical protein